MDSQLSPAWSWMALYCIIDEGALLSDFYTCYRWQGDQTNTRELHSKKFSKPFSQNHMALWINLVGYSVCSLLPFDSVVRPCTTHTTSTVLALSLISINTTFTAIMRCRAQVLLRCLPSYTWWELEKIWSRLSIVWWTYWNATLLHRIRAGLFSQS